MGQLPKERIFSHLEQILLFKSTPSEKDNEYFHVRVGSLEGESVPLKCCICTVHDIKIVILKSKNCNVRLIHFILNLICLQIRPPYHS